MTDYAKYPYATLQQVGTKLTGISDALGQSNKGAHDVDGLSDDSPGSTTRSAASATSGRKASASSATTSAAWASCPRRSARWSASSTPRSPRPCGRVVDPAGAPAALRDPTPRTACRTHR